MDICQHDMHKLQDTSVLIRCEAGVSQDLMLNKKWAVNSYANLI